MLYIPWLSLFLTFLFDSQQTPVVLIPAIKGSREKHGLSLKKSSVSWAEDVYDPPPSIASHTRNKKQQQHKSKSKDNHKKAGKKGQKNSSSRSGKDKKQAARKHSRGKFDWVTQMPIAAASSWMALAAFLPLLSNK